jgi:hypothetical protein
VCFLFFHPSYCSESARLEFTQADLTVINHKSRTEFRQSAAKPLTKDEARPALEVRPHDENDNSRAQRQQQHKAEIVFCSVHLNETSGVQAQRAAVRATLLKIELAEHHPEPEHPCMFGIGRPRRGHHGRMAIVRG